MDQVDCVVVGAGVVGLAIARALAKAGRETLILERETLIGSGISSRNSEVIHAGIYYPKGSVRARLCVAGKRRLYEYCASHHVEHRNCGKLIVAANEAQIGELEGIKRAAEGNGVDDLLWLDAAEIRRLEPALHGARALLSPSTGIVDSHGYMLSLLGEAEDAGAVIAYATSVTGAALEKGRVLITINGETEPSLSAQLLVNSAGLDALELAGAIEGFPAGHVPEAWFAKGNYFTLSCRAPFSRLIYPVPEPGGLGVHLTLDLAGQARFGPDVEWLKARRTDALDFTVDPARAQRFYAAVRGWWPGLADNALEPAYCGIRPKLSGPGQPAEDFRIEGVATHGIPAVINLFGIESPGLTAALAIADEVARMAQDALDA